MTRAKRTLLSVSFSALALLGCNHAPPASVAPADDVPTIAAPPSVTAQGVQVPAALDLTGTLLADEESHVAPLVAGRVDEVYVERGSIVAEGDPLVRLRNTDFRLQMSAARAGLESARARLGMEDGAAPPRAEDVPEVQSARAQMELRDSELTRAQGLREQGVFTQSQLDQAAAAAASARSAYATALQNTRASIAGLASAQSTLTQASTALGDSTVRAPFAGEIAARNVSPGEYVSAQSQLITLVRTDPLRIEVQIPQEHLFDVHEDQAVEVRVDAAPDQVFHGTIRYVSAAVEAGSRGMIVEAVIPNSDAEHRLRPGMFARARILLGHDQPMASVPLAAVLTQAGVSRVFIIRDGHIEERVVSVHEIDGDTVTIADGVAAGDVLATGNLEQLADGMRIQG